MKQSQKLTNEQVDPFFTEWTNIQERIIRSHQLRDNSSEIPMLKAIQVFQRLLIHCDGLASPLNCAERLNFVEQQPTSFAAFRQLDELFGEMKKAIASKRIQLNRSES